MAVLQIKIHHMMWSAMSFLLKIFISSHFFSFIIVPSQNDAWEEEEEEEEGDCDEEIEDDGEER